MLHGVDSVGGIHPMGMWFDGNKVVWNTSASSSAKVTGIIKALE